jgi:4-carboxymuconolactone decarboxylase
MQMPSFIDGSSRLAASHGDGGGGIIPRGEAGRSRRGPSRGSVGAARPQGTPRDGRFAGVAGAGILRRPRSSTARRRPDKTGEPGEGRPPAKKETTAMAESELYKKGAEMRRQLLGDDYTQRVNSTVYGDPHTRKFIDLATETVFGAIWTRPGIDLKTRTLVTVVSDVSTGRHEELAIHLRMALRQGWKEEELDEAILHLLGYVGAPLVRDAMIVARKVYAEVAAK